MAGAHSADPDRKNCLIFTILCLMPLPIRYAQEARNYSLLFHALIGLSVLIL